MSTSLLVLVPLRIEQLALGVPDGSRVLRTGMGPERARIAAARALGNDAPAVAIAGLCAGIAPGLHAGDVICATELLGAEPPLRLPEAARLAPLLRRHGLHVHLGPLVSAPRILGAAERRDLDGEALGVDMESAWLAGGAGGRPLAVVRVVADAAGRSLTDPHMLTAGFRALAALRRTREALGEWALSLAADPADDRPVRSGSESPSPESPSPTRELAAL